MKIFESFICQAEDLAFFWLGYYKIIKLNFYCYTYNNRIEEIKNYIIANIPSSTIINFELKGKNNINKKSIITSDFYTTCNTFLTLNLINYKEKILLGKCCCKPQFSISNFDYSLFEYHTFKDLVFCNKKPEHRFRNIFKLLTVDEYNNLKDKENFSVTIPIESQIDIEKNEVFFKSQAIKSVSNIQGNENPSSGVFMLNQ